LLESRPDMEACFTAFYSDAIRFARAQAEQRRAVNPSATDDLVAAPRTSASAATTLLGSH
jgi:hypothetical protein